MKGNLLMLLKCIAFCRIFCFYYVLMLLLHLTFHSSETSVRNPRQNRPKMSSAEQSCYTLIHVPTDTEFPSEQQLKEKLEKGGFC